MTDTLLNPGDEHTRVRLGAASDTAPDLLLALAADPRLTVRAAVAMNAAATAQVDSLLAGDADERVRTLLARKLAGLLPDLPSSQRNWLEDTALATLAQLVEDTASRVRAAIADALKDMPHAPRALILRLAQDSEMAVFDPVVRLSPLLSEADLLALMARPGSAATATAIARRAGLPAAVADAIAASADTGAIARLLENPSAAIREATLDGLVARATAHETWHQPLVRRPALSPQAARALSDIVATQLLAELASRADLPPDLAAELHTRLASRLTPEGPPAATPRAEPDIADAMAAAHALYADGSLDEDALLAAIERGEARTATALLAVAAGVPASVVDRAATLRSTKGLVALVWTAGFTMRSATPLQSLLARIAPAATLKATAKGAFPLSTEEMRWQIEFLGRMGR